MSNDTHTEAALVDSEPMTERGERLPNRLLMDERDAMVRRAMKFEQENAVMRGQCQAYKQVVEIMARAAVKG